MRLPPDCHVPLLQLSNPPLLSLACKPFEEQAAPEVITELNEMSLELTLVAFKVVVFSVVELTVVMLPVVADIVPFTVKPLVVIEPAESEFVM